MALRQALLLLLRSGSRPAKQLRLPLAATNLRLLPTHACASTTRQHWRFVLLVLLLVRVVPLGVQVRLGLVLLGLLVLLLLVGLLLLLLPMLHSLGPGRARASSLLALRLRLQLRLAVALLQRRWPVVQPARPGPSAPGGQRHAGQPAAAARSCRCGCGCCRRALGPSPAAWRLRQGGPPQRRLPGHIRGRPLVVARHQAWGAAQPRCAVAKADQRHRSRGLPARCAQQRPARGQEPIQVQEQDHKMP